MVHDREMKDEWLYIGQCDKGGKVSYSIHSPTGKNSGCSEENPPNNLLTASDKECIVSGESSYRFDCSQSAHQEL
jgi:hypothetical protein